jgi:PAS domain S-box-containing protein
LHKQFVTASAAKHDEATKFLTGRLSVLQIEDSESDAALVQRSLERAGYRLDCERVETANKMRAALTQGSWDVIVADYHLPQFDAKSALEVLLSTGRDIPFIVVSGAVGEDVAVAMMKRGAHDFVTKDNLARLAPAVQREIKEAWTREQRKQAEAALRQSEREFRELAESIPQLVWITTDNGETIYCNSRCQEQLGVGPGQLLSDHWAEMLHPDDYNPCLTAWEQSLKAGTEFQRECRFRTANDEYRWFLLRASPVNEHREHATRWFGTSTDIDNQKQSQAQLLRVNQELARSNSLLEQFAYVASHDLQEPLRTIAVYVQLLSVKCKGRLSATAEEYLGFVHQAAVRMHRLVNDLLAFSRAGRPDQALLPTNLEDLLDGVLNNLSARIEETGATITRDELPAVMADSGQISQLLQNLIGNALKYRNGKELPVIGISAKQQQNEWVFAVRDNGIGINPRYFEQIFRIFNRLHTQDKYDGTGIGLAICQRIVERHKGRLWVESAEGVGSTFYFTIPDALDGNVAALGESN